VHDEQFVLIHLYTQKHIVMSSVKPVLVIKSDPWLPDTRSYKQELLSCKAVSYIPQKYQLILKTNEKKIKKQHSELSSTSFIYQLMHNRVALKEY